MSALKRARQQYLQRCEDLEKAKAMTAKAEEETGGYKTLDKRRKSRDDAQTKVILRIWLILTLYGSIFPFITQCTCFKEKVILTSVKGNYILKLIFRNYLDLGNTFYVDNTHLIHYFELETDSF